MSKIIPNEKDKPKLTPEETLEHILNEIREAPQDIKNKAKQQIQEKYNRKLKMAQQLKKQKKLNLRLNQDKGMDKATHNRIEEILKQRIIMGDGDLDIGYGRMHHKKKDTGKKKVKARRGTLANPWIVFLKKYSGKGYTRKELLSMYRKKYKKAKTKGQGNIGQKRKKTKKRGKKKNPYILFLKKHAGQGYTRKQLVKMYKQS